MRMTCREIYGFLDDFIAGELDDSTRTSFEGHLGRCDSCRAYLATYRATLAAARVSEKTDESTDMNPPEEMIEAILAARVSLLKANRSK